MKFPDFIIIGAMKCATTVLWHNLNKHPEIHMGKNPDDPKIASTEIRFWNNGHPHKTWDKGFDWYKGLFEGKIAGEKCANYIESKLAMKRISEYVPHVKLVLCIRNPIDRAYSEYNMQKNKKGLKHFDFLVAKQHGYLKRGMYFNQIYENILPFFQKDQLYVLIQEAVWNNTNVCMNDLYQFLGASPFQLDVRKVTSKEATDRNLDLEKDKNLKFYKKWKSNYPSMSGSVRTQLENFYREPNKKLFNFLGHKIKEWYI
jgi:hypothetical protein